MRRYAWIPLLLLLAACDPATAPKPNADMADDGASAVASVALAAEPFTNGPILFTGSENGTPGIYIMNPDGSDAARISSPDEDDRQSAWSPDGIRFAFVRQVGVASDIFVMNADGTGAVNLTNSANVREESPSWSPDGTRIVFSSLDFSDDLQRIEIMNADGTGRITVLQGGSNDALLAPSWAPGGSRIAFIKVDQSFVVSDVYLMSPDGSGLVNVTNTPGDLDLEPAWSPDGSRIVFSSTLGASLDRWLLHVMNADGSGRSMLTTGVGISDRTAVWSPDGAKIAFGSFFRTNTGSADVFVMNADGTGLVNITAQTLPGTDPSWTSRAVSRLSDCTEGKWAQFGFKNQGQCVKYVRR